jgi:hypothetical protein
VRKKGRAPNPVVDDFKDILAVYYVIVIFQCVVLKKEKVGKERL